MNVYVKIPVTNTRREFAGDLIGALAGAGVQLNVTASLLPPNKSGASESPSPKTAGVVSVFAGRIADTGRDPVPHMAEALHLLRPVQRRSCSGQAPANF